MAKGVNVKSDVSTKDVVMTDTPLEVFSIPILETVKAAQLQNGLRHRDFQRYRQYCARRLRRIRKSTKLTNGKGKQFVNTVKQLDVATISDARILYLPLYHAERAWSYAMELKEQDHNEKMEQGEDANSRIKFHLHGRLRKAAEWSQRFMELCSLRGDARTSLEAEAYVAFMLGNYTFHREEHEKALTHFRTARRIYSDLLSVGSQTLFNQLIQEVEPFIRFCEHRLGRKTVVMDWKEETTNALLQSKIELVLLEARKQKATTATSITWKQSSVVLPTSEISLAWIQPEEIMIQLEKVPINDEKKKEQVFLSLLSAYDTILSLLKTRIHQLQQQSKSGSALVHTEIDTCFVLEEYIEYLKQTRQVERLMDVYKQLRVDKEKHSLGDFIHVLDMIIQSVRQILSISGLIEKEVLIYAKYTAYQALFQSIRAATIAQSYVNQRQFSKAIALYQYATGFLQEAEEILLQQPAATDDVLQAYLKALGEELIGAQSRTTAQSFLYTSKQQEILRNKMDTLEITTETSVQYKTLLERQEEYTSGTSKGLYQVVRIPPEFQAIPCKPILFDMAFNTLEFPDISERMKTEEEKQAEANAVASSASSGGFFGWFRK